MASFGIIEKEYPVTYVKKREWFDLGARAYDQVRPGTYAVPTYVCPICVAPFAVEALDNGQLSVEHVPPQSVGGRGLLLTCTACNNIAGTKLDAAAKTKEEVLLAMAGKAPRPHRVKMHIGGMKVNGQLHTVDGSYRLTIPKELNKPGTSDALRPLTRAGASLTVEHERYSELGARISWLRAGYLALVAMQGYQFVVDPALDIVRFQIMECDERRMVTFVADIPEDIPLTIQRVLRVVAPAWHLGWTVQFGPYLVNLPPGRHDLLRPTCKQRPHAHRAIHDVRVHGLAHHTDLRALVMKKSTRARKSVGKLSRKESREIGLRLEHAGLHLSGQVLRLDLYRLICYFHTSKHLAKLTDMEDFPHGRACGTIFKPQRSSAFSCRPPWRYDSLVSVTRTSCAPNAQSWKKRSEDPPRT